MKKVLFLILAVVLVFVLSLPFFWQQIYNLFPNEGNGDTSQLLFKSADGSYTIYIENREVGKVKSKEEKLFPKLESGRKELKIVRDTEFADSYFTLTRTIDFMPATQIEIEWNSGPTLESSEGTIKYFSKINKPSGAEVLIEPFPTDSKVEFNSISEPGNKLSVTSSDTYKVKVSNRDGFSTKEFDLRLVDDITNSVPKNIRLVVEVYLYKKPFIN